MRKSVLALLTLICIMLVGCGNSSEKTMVWKDQGFTVKVSTTEDAVIVPETCMMRSADGFVVKVLDGTTAREKLKAAKNMGNLGFSVQDNGDYLYDVTYSDYSTETPTEEIDYVVGLKGVDLVVVVSAIESNENFVDIDRLISFVQSLQISTKGNYTAYNWENFLAEATAQREEDHRNEMNRLIDESIASGSTIAQDALGKDRPETQEDYDKILEYDANQDNSEDEDEDSLIDFNFKNSDGSMLFSFSNATQNYAYNAEDDTYLSTDGNFKVKLSIVNNIQENIDKLSEDYKKYSVDDVTCVAINETTLDCSMFWQVSTYATQIHITKVSDNATYDQLLDVLSYINTMRSTSLYTFNTDLADSLGINAGYRTTSVAVTPIELKEYTGISDNSNLADDDEAATKIEEQ